MNILSGRLPAVRPVLAAGIFLAMLAACSSAGNNNATVPPSAQESTPIVPVTGELTATPAASIPPTSAATLAAGRSPTSAAIAEASRPVQTQASIPDPAEYAWAPVVTGLDRPISMANAGDGSGRLFILEQAGRIRTVQEGNLLPDPFLDIVDRVGSGSSEQGLLGLAFHPEYPATPYFYINYTDKNGDTVIARYQVSGDPNEADPDSEKMLIQVDQPYANHNGGSTVFGPDGYLYLGLGDGGSAGDPHGNAQSLDTLLGKILRIDVNQGDPYGIPGDNPFINGSRPEIWAYGLRNPWRLSFDRQSGDLFIADVGQNVWEEIDLLPTGSPAGANFGWSFREGAHRYKDVAPPADAGLIDPIWEYSHAEGGCSVTGGMIYRGPSVPAWNGVYFAGDYCSGLIWGVVPANGGWSGAQIYATDFAITSFGEDEAGELYLLDHRGSVYRLGPK